MKLSRVSSYLHINHISRFLHSRKQSFLPVEKVFVYLLIKGKEKINELYFLDWN